MNKITIITIFVLLVGIIALFLAYKKDKDLAKNILYKLAYEAVLKAEEAYNIGNGKEKLKLAVQYVKDNLPWFLKWLIPDNTINDAIEYILTNLQTYFKGKTALAEAVIDKGLSIITNGKSDTLFDELQWMKESVEKTGKIEGFVDIGTDKKK